MTLINTIKQITPGFTPTIYSSRPNIATNVGTVVTTLPAAGAFTPTPIQSGRWRAKTVSVVATGTVQQGIVTVTDGTTILTVFPQQTAGAANALQDITMDFQTDLNNTSMSITIIAGTANSVHDFEVTGNP